MLKIAINGKARSGKDTFAKILKSKLLEKEKICIVDIFAFADPLKKAAKVMFPLISDDWLYGKSELRENIVPGTDFSVRDLLIDISNLGKKYNPNIWIDNMDQKIKKTCHDAIIISDQRFIAEFSYLLQNKFLTIRIKRDDCKISSDVSETEQDGILDMNYDYIIDNNKDLFSLEKQASEIIALLYSK